MMLIRERDALRRPSSAATDHARCASHRRPLRKGDDLLDSESGGRQRPSRSASSRSGSGGNHAWCTTAACHPCRSFIQSTLIQKMRRMSGHSSHPAPSGWDSTDYRTSPVDPSAIVLGICPLEEKAPTHFGLWSRLAQAREKFFYRTKLNVICGRYSTVGCTPACGV